MRGLIAACASVCLVTVQAQKNPEPLFSVQGGLHLPVALDNPVFNRIAVIQGQFDLAAQYPLWNGFGAGLGAKLGIFGLDDRAFAPLYPEGTMQRTVFYGKLQYEKYIGPKTYFELFWKGGHGSWDWKCTNCPGQERIQAFHWSAGGGIYIHASDNLAFGLLLAYDTEAARMTPSTLGLESWPGRSDTSAPYRFFTVGLGFSTRFIPDPDGAW